MLRSTFRHLPGIGRKREAALWESGVTTLDALRALRESQQLQLPLFDRGRLDFVNRVLDQSIAALGQNDASFFARLLDQSEQYRIVLAYPDDTLFLDIETTGLSSYYDKITLVGWWIDGSYEYWLRGTKPDAMRQAVRRAKALVTFNGTLFDIPFLRSEFADLTIPDAHVDLRFFARRVGLSGPQKDIELQLNVRRPRTVSKMRGEAAPLLWHDFIRGNKSACRRLITYNKADIDGMRHILDFVILSYFEKAAVPPSVWRPASYRFARPREPKLREFNIPNPRRARTTTNPRPIELDDLVRRSGPEMFVGIDLTGSERRPSGWALIAGGEATTLRLGSDDELIAATLEARPTVVSIDSPLSLPRGRTRVTDDDPGRQEYGILRECERVLHHRRVNVYPSLIQSMQALTARGIRLAKDFRKRGVPVIESFPGAAQDIMSIPRKRKDLRLLASGLKEFGIGGSFTHLRTSHDELDAITSAAVAAFFWAGRFEALGNPQEEYLIIPSRDSTRVWTDRVVIGLSGQIEAGKTTTGRFLAERGFHYTRYSLVLGRMLEAEGITPTREALQRFGREVHDAPGQRWLCAQLLSQLPNAASIVIDGLRWPEDHAYMVEAFGPRFLHLFIETSEDLRRLRHIAAGGSDQSFYSADHHASEEQVSAMKGLSHRVVHNNATIAELQDQVLLALMDAEHGLGTILKS